MKVAIPEESDEHKERFKAVQSVMEQQVSMIRELQRSMKQLKESQLAQRERYRRINWNIIELFERSDVNCETQHTHKRSIAALNARVPNTREHFADVRAPMAPQYQVTPRT